MTSAASGAVAQTNPPAAATPSARPVDRGSGAAVGARVSGSKRRSAAGLICSAHRSLPLATSGPTCVRNCRRKRTRPLRQSRATIRLGPDPLLPVCATEARSLLPTCARYDACPPTKILRSTVPEARSRRRSGRSRTGVCVAESDSQSASRPTATQPGWPCTCSVAVTPRVVTPSPE